MHSPSLTRFLTAAFLTSIVLAALALTTPAALVAQSTELTFAEVGAEAGFLPYTPTLGKGFGVALADYDADGDIDIFLPTGPDEPHHLYRNRGDGTFDEVAAEAGLDIRERGRLALWVDADADGLLDLVLSADCWRQRTRCGDDVTLLVLYRQIAPGRFAEAQRLLEPPGDSELHRGGMVAGDLDEDGFPEVVLGRWDAEPNTAGIHLFRNFEGSFGEENVFGPLVPELYRFYQPSLHDWDRNGRLDLYAAVDAQPNTLYLSFSNLGGGGAIEGAPGMAEMHFEVADAAVGLGDLSNDMGQTLGDVDNDGDLDIYLTNITQGTRHHVLYRNDTPPGPLFDQGGAAALRFTEIAVAAGVADGDWGWGATFLDADADGDLDLAATNGWIGSGWATDRSRFFLNIDAALPRFAEVGEAVGFDDREWGSALAAADLDRDGDLDLVQTVFVFDGPSRLRLHENRTSRRGLGNYLVVRPRRSARELRPLGALVRVEVGGEQMMRLISAGTSFMTQEPAEAFFGLGGANRADRVIVEWTDGQRTELRDVAAGQVLDVRRIEGWIYKPQ